MRILPLILIQIIFFLSLSCQTRVKVSDMEDGTETLLKDTEGGISEESHNPIIFFEDFENQDYGKKWRVHWSKAVGSGLVAVPSKYVFSGRRSAYLQTEAGKHKSNGEGEYVPEKPINNVAYVKVFLRLEDGFTMGTANQIKLFSIKGCKTIDLAYGQAGKTPNGHDRFSAVVMLDRWNEIGVYFYHPEQKGGYGEIGYCERFFCNPKILPGKWYCIELMLKANEPGRRDGEIKIWLDNDLIIDIEKLRFRDIRDVKIRRFAFTAYFGGGGIKNTAPQDQRIFIDNFTISRQRIGCGLKQ